MVDAQAVATLQARVGANIPVVGIDIGTQVTVDVDVNEMTIPYTIALDGGVVIKSLVDRRAELQLAPGTHRLGWAFAHTEKNWRHLVRLTVGSNEQALEERSEAKKHADHSVGVAFLVVG